MNRKQCFLTSLALGAAAALAQGSLQAQSLNYGVSISSLPARVGQPFTITVPVPTTVPDGTAFSYLASPQPYAGTYSQAFGVSINHQFTIQAPAFTTPGIYAITVGQVGGSTSVGVSTPSALNAAVVDLLVSPAGQSPNPLATFTGNYAFLFRGETPASPGAVQGAAAAGTFTADGKGNITAGTLDVNTAAGFSMQNAAVTGTYQLDTAGRGTLLLRTPQGPVNFNFYVPPVRPGILVNTATLVPAGGFTGKGEVSRAGNFFDHGSVFANSYGNSTPIPLDTSIEFSEEPTSGGGFLSGAGLLEFTQGLTLTGISQAIPGSPDLFAGAAGTYSDQSAGGFFANMGRSTLTLSAPSQSPATPTHYAFYPASAGPAGVPVLYFLSLDPHPATALVVGSIQR